MKTKPAERIATAFPTCGEVFHYLVTALDLTAWGNAFHDPKAKTKRRNSSELTALSDQLRDWATEADDRVPTRGEFGEFIAQQLCGLPRAEKLAFVLTGVWNRVLDEHTAVARENTTYLDRDGTRAWYAKWHAPGTIYFLWALQKLLRRLAEANGPMLDAPLNELLANAWPEADAATKSPTHPLQRTCYKYYAALRPEEASSVASKTVAAWESGEDRPSCDALGRHFANGARKIGLVLNFAFAGLLETLAKTMTATIAVKDLPDCRELLLNQARCVHSLDDAVAEELARTPDMSLIDYERLLAKCLDDYKQFLGELPRGGLDALDLRVAKFRCYPEYQVRVLDQPRPPARFEFWGRLENLWKETALKIPEPNSNAVQTELANLRAEHPAYAAFLAGPLLAIEARQALRHTPPTQESLQRAFGLYQQAFDESRYAAGTYATRIAREALGLAALLHRRETSEGSIRPWMKKALAWWDLLGCGSDFDHEQLEQRIELAESWFTNRLHKDLRDRLKAALPQLGLNHIRVGGTFVSTESERTEKLEATPVARKQKNPMTDTIVGRAQSPLMEAIDRGQLDRAREIVRKGGELNFINSTGDTCVTKAFARKDYALVLEILRRDENPIRRETVLRVTNNKRISGLEQTLTHGQVEILRELAEPKVGRREDIDLNTERIWKKTPLYYALSLLRWSGASPEINAPGVFECIDYLVNNLRVDLDTPNTNDNSVLTYAVEFRFHDVATMLLKAGANVNHRFQGGGTALLRAIINDDYEMAKLLLEYKADPRLFVDARGRPIYEMPMSERMRRLIPARPS